MRVVVISVTEPGRALAKLLPYEHAHGRAAEVLRARWRDVDGLKMPFKISLQQNGRKFADLTAEEYKFNSGLKAEELSRKP